MAKTKKKTKKPEVRKTQNSAAKPMATTSGRIPYKTIIVVIALLVLTYISFYPSLKNGLTNWDDPGYVTENPHIRDVNAPAAKYMFTHFIMSNYHPLTMLSLALDYQKAQLNPRRYHLVNVLFHLLNTLLVFFFIYKLSGKRLLVAAMVALLFGIHPMHVESVSWISSRKDVLFAFFYLLGMITYLSYLNKNKLKVMYYVFTFALFVLSALCKPAALTFPVVLLLLDFYHKRKFTAAYLLDKIPFFAISVLFGVLSVKAQSAGSAIALWNIMGIQYRFIFASYGFVSYIYKFLLPVNLSAFYPYPVPFPIATSLPIFYYIAPCIVLALFYLVWRSLKISRLYAFGFLFFLVNLVLVLQFISVGAAIMADRYSYLPFIGLAFVAAMELHRLYGSKNPSLTVVKYGASVLLLVVAIAFCTLTYQRTQIWKNNATLWTDVIDKYPDKAEIAYKNRGNYYAREVNQYEKAMQDYNSFIALSSKDPTIYSNRGNLFYLMKRYQESLKDYDTAIALDSTYADAWVNKGNTLMEIKKYDSAIICFNRGIQLDPNRITSYQSRAYCYESIGRNDEAIAEYTWAITKQPGFYNNYFYRAIAYFNKKQYKECIADFTKSIELKPDYGDAYYNRSQVFNILGDYKGALADAEKSQTYNHVVAAEYLNLLKSKIK
ncbi:MAG: tetratricopeptide repeat protein [Bacteroidota bacterium]